MLAFHHQVSILSYDHFRIIFPHCDSYFLIRIGGWNIWCRSENGCWSDTAFNMQQWRAKRQTCGVFLQFSRESSPAKTIILLSYKPDNTQLYCSLHSDNFLKKRPSRPSMYPCCSIESNDACTVDINRMSLPIGLLRWLDALNEHELVQPSSLCPTGKD